MQVDPAAAKMMLTHMLKPWHESVADPVTAQETVLHKLVTDFAKTLPVCHMNLACPKSGQVH